MMKKIILIFILLYYGCATICKTASCQNKNNLIIETESVFQKGIIIESREFYENGNIEEEIFFTNGTLTIMKEYYENGKLEEIFNLKNRTYIEYDEDGTIDDEGTIDDLTLGILMGVSELIKLAALTELIEIPQGNGMNKEYYENGILKEEISYKDGKLDGIYKEYYENGSLKSQSTFKNGVLDGSVIEYYSK